MVMIMKSLSSHARSSQSSAARISPACPEDLRHFERLQPLRFSLDELLVEPLLPVALAIGGLGGHPQGCCDLGVEAKQAPPRLPRTNAFLIEPFLIVRPLEVLVDFWKVRLHLKDTSACLDCLMVRRAR